MEAKRFTGKEGKIISASEARKLTEPHLGRERNILDRGENFVKAEFFGIHTFNELIGLHGSNCVGFRVYYGISEEEDNSHNSIDKLLKKPTSRLVIVPVDENGKDIIREVQLGGIKDMPAERDAMVGGPICPRQC